MSNRRPSEGARCNKRSRFKNSSPVPISSCLKCWAKVGWASGLSHSCAILSASCPSSLKRGAEQRKSKRGLPSSGLQGALARARLAFLEESPRGTAQRWLSPRQQVWPIVRARSDGRGSSAVCDLDATRWRVTVHPVLPAGYPLRVLRISHPPQHQPQAWGESGGEEKTAENPVTTLSC
ncbi:hypothetical protein LZ30DRAFT_22290 [Colletotrichum cereale]|nr:hypothetical protein LZ30DRAFT_22290 [Colletotrichum cereale]